MRRSIGTALCIAAVLVCWLGARSLGAHALDKRASWPKSEDYAVFLPPPSVAPVIFAGYRQLMADITWIRSLVYYGSSLAGEADYRYLEQFIDNTLALDPKFKRAHRWAIYAVTFKHETATQDEYRVAVRYAEKAIEAFPDTYEFYWIAGIRYFFDLYSDDPEELQRFRERGAELIEKAMHKKDAPKDLASLAASLRMKLGQQERALSSLREMILTTDNPEAQQKLIARYNALAKAEFPAEAKQAKEEFDLRWKSELYFASPSMYVLLGDRPSPVIDFDALATERDLFGADMDLSEGSVDSLLPAEAPVETSAEQPSANAPAQAAAEQTGTAQATPGAGQ